DPERMNEALQFDGFRLFVERAKQRGTDLRIDKASIPGICDLLFKLDGLPLAIEMAAGLTDVLSVREISQSIAECLDAPTGTGPEDVRQHTVSATIEWSRRLLTPEAQALLDRVSIFPNTWTLEGAGAVCLPGAGHAQVRDLARQLVDHSLLFTVRTRHDDLRFGLLQTTRQVIARRAGSQSELADSYLAYCQRLIDTARSYIDAGQESRAYELIEQDYETLVKALDLAFERAPEQCARMALALHSFWMSGTRLIEGRTWYERLSNREQIAPSTRVSVQIALSSLCILLGDNAGASRILVEAAETVRPIGGFELARVIGNLAVHRDRMGQYAEAKEGFELCCRLFGECGARREEAQSWLNLGVVKLRLNEPLSECAELYRRALICARSIGSASVEAKGCSCLAHLELKEGRLREALALNKQGLLLWLTDPNIPECNLAMLDLAEIFVRMESFEAAAKAFHIAERLEELSHAPLPSLHRDRLDTWGRLAKSHLSAADWRSGQRLVRSKGFQEVVTMAIRIVEAGETEDA
ncbi:MAG TPA: hypothetical protein VMI31_03865, partial [Fimbriimonadaceae bacterium]|nr:hypothetical protein [Fimbriimonadaceae bacterium]